MSRIGNKPVSIPAGVTVDVLEGKLLVKGPKGSLEVALNSGIDAKVEGNQLTFTRKT